LPRRPADHATDALARFIIERRLVDLAHHQLAEAPEHAGTQCAKLGPSLTSQKLRAISE
jgi:hypothetical protein